MRKSLNKIHWLRELVIKILEIDVKKKESTSQTFGKAKEFYEYAKQKGLDVPNDFETFYDVLNSGKRNKFPTTPEGVSQKIATHQELWQIFEDLAKKDTIVHKWDNKWSDRFKAILEEKGITNGKEFTKFIKANTLTEQDKQDKKLVAKVRKEKDYHDTQIGNCYYSQLGIKEQWNFLVYPFYSLLILAYPVRFFVLAVCWSIWTLKKDEEWLYKISFLWLIFLNYLVTIQPEKVH